jgi:beta-propeller uncharacterized protein DUF5122
VLKGLGEAQTQKVQPDNKIIVAGYNTDFSGSFYDITAGRLNADGSVDSAFGTNGSITNYSGESCNDIALLPFHEDPLITGKEERIYMNKITGEPLRFLPGYR